MLRPLIEKLIDKQNLTKQESAAAIQTMLSESNPQQTAAFLALMRAKGETIEELNGIIGAMRELMIPVCPQGPVLDIVGTGGDGAHTVNISTGAAILAASCGVKIAKHGNRSVSSLSGSADVLEALGIKMEGDPSQIEKAIAEIGIGFMFAPLFHPAMKRVKEIRSHLKIRTFFNLIGPLLNPANAQHLLVGVFNEDLLESVAKILASQHCKRSFVVHGCGLDELSTIGPAQVLEITPNGIRKMTIDPQALGLPRATLEDLRGTDAAGNAELLLRAFSGEKGAIADTLALNAAAALYLYGIAESIEEGLKMAQEALKQGKALALLNRWRNYGQ